MHVYLDTNFLVKLQQNKGDYAKCLASLRHRVSNDGWRCATSDFALMEFVDVLQENSWVLQELGRGQHIDEIIRNKRSRVLERRRVKLVQDHVRNWLAADPGLIEIPDVTYPSRDLFRLASAMCLNGPIMAPDAVHLAAALLLGCEMVLTGDDLFVTSVNQHLAKKGSVLRRLTFRLIEEITGASIEPSELDQRGRIISAYRVREFLNKHPAPILA